MSDFRFKVSGTSTPFIAELYNASDCTMVSKQLVEFAGSSSPADVCNHTCVIFDGLAEQTCYYVKLVDDVGNIAYSSTGSSACSTPQNPVVTPIELNVNLLGTVCKPPSGNQYITELVCAPKYVDFTPPLTAGQCVGLSFCLNSDLNDSNERGSAISTLYCKPNGSNIYSVVCSASGPATSEDFTIQVCQGDQLCYDISTSVLNLVPLEQCLAPYGGADLCLYNVTPLAGFGGCCNITCGPTTCLGVYECITVPTTTTTTSLPTVQVYLDNPQCTTNVDPITNECVITVTAKLATCPTLSSGQCFRVCLALDNSYGYQGALNENMCTVSRVSNRSKSETLTLKNCTASSCAVSNSEFFDVTSSNINDICVCTIACDNTRNSIISHFQRASVSICGISEMVNGNYLFDGLGLCKSITSFSSGGFELPEEV